MIWSAWSLFDSLRASFFRTKTCSSIERQVRKEKKRRYARRIPLNCIAASCSDLTLSGYSPDVQPTRPDRSALVCCRDFEQWRSACLCNVKRVTARHTAEKSPPFSASPTSGIVCEYERDHTKLRRLISITCIPTTMSCAISILCQNSLRKFS